MVFKNLIAPIQMWLLGQGRCVGCGTDLSKGIVKEIRGKTTVTCQCGRVFIHQSDGSYRRALFEEI